MKNGKEVKLESFEITREHFSKTSESGMVLNLSMSSEESSFRLSIPVTNHKKKEVLSVFEKEIREKLANPFDEGTIKTIFS